eukprot:403361062
MLQQIFAISRLTIYLAIAFYTYSIFQAFLIYVLLDCFNNYVIMPFVFGLHKIQEGPPTIFQRCGYNVAIHAITKGEIQSIDELKKQVLSDQPKTFNRFMSKVVHFMNNYYLKDVTNSSEFVRLFDKAFIEIQDEFSNEQDVLDYIRTKIVPIRFKHDELQFKMFLIKRFAAPAKKISLQIKLNKNEDSYENKSCVIFFYSHVITDGVGGFLALNALQEKLDLDNLPLMQTTPWKYNSKMSQATDESLLTNPMFEFVKDQNGYYLTKDYCVNDVKHITKQLKCTINDLCMTAIGIAIRKYADEHQINIKDKIQFGLAVSQRNRPNYKEDIIFNNQFRGQNSHFRVPSSTSTDEIQATIKENIESGNYIREMPYRYGNSFKSRLITYLMPVFLLQKAMTGSTNEICTFTSNISGQPRPIKLGKNVFTEKLHFAGSSSQNDFDLNIKYLLFNICSHNNILRMSVSHANMNVNGKDIIQFLETAFDDLSLIAKKINS